MNDGLVLPALARREAVQNVFDAIRIPVRGADAVIDVLAGFDSEILLLHAGHLLENGPSLLVGPLDVVA